MSCIRNIERFNHREIGSFISEHAWLLVNFSGLKTMSIFLPSGRSLFSETGNRAFTALVPSGSCCHAVYEEGRENWVIKLDPNQITESDSGDIELCWSGMVTQLSGFTHLDTLRTDRCRDLLTRLLQNFHTPDQMPMTINLAFGALLDCVTDQMLHPPAVADPARELRDRIIADRRFTSNLTQLSRACGYSADHLRILFSERYRTTPKAFQTDYRMRLAKDMLEAGTMSVQEIAEDLGYDHTAHFSTAFKKYFGLSPRRKR